MTAEGGGSLNISQGYEVLAPRSGPAFPIPCTEWDYLVERLRQVENPPWFFQAGGFTLIGAAITTLIALLSGAVPSVGDARFVAWSATIVAGVLGISFLALHRRELALHRSAVSDVLRQMELIETRYDRRSEV